MAKATGVPAYTLQQLAAFVAVADTGTIAAAAVRLQLSPSAVRASLGDLERALGAQLCVRHRAKGVELTSGGKAVLAKARVVLHEANDLELDVRGEPGQVTGVLHVGCYTTLGPTVLPPLLDAFRRRYPAARIELREDTLDRLRTAVDARDVDVTIAYDIDLPRHWSTVAWLTNAPRVHMAAAHRHRDRRELRRAPGRGQGGQRPCVASGEDRRRLASGREAVAGRPGLRSAGGSTRGARGRAALKRATRHTGNAGEPRNNRRNSRFSAVRAPLILSAKPSHDDPWRTE